MIPRRENELKAACLQEILALGVAYFPMAHQDVRKSGCPDISLSGKRLTTWWEFKHGTPNFESQGIQEYKCRRLARTSYCRYVVYLETARKQQVLIIHPDEVHGRDGKTLLMVPEYTFIGHNHAAVVAHMTHIHEALGQSFVERSL